MVKPKPEPQGINWRKRYTRSTAEMISTSSGGNPFTSKAFLVGFPNRALQELALLMHLPCLLHKMLPALRLKATPNPKPRP